MTKEDVVDIVADATGNRKAIVSEVIDSMLGSITAALSIGDKVQFYGFGTFDTVQRAPRIGLNPHTKEKIPIPARIVPVFTAGKKLKDATTKDV